MNIFTIYLETTLFNFPFVDDAPQYRADTEQVWEAIRAGKFTPYTSTYTSQELEDTPDEIYRQKMLRLIPDFGVTVLQPTAAVDRLAGLYITGAAIPVGFYTDALHIAITTVYRLDCIVSLNFRHIVREWTIKKVAEINAREGYPAVGIYRPAEVLRL
ncbi:MAG: hypothetical protein LBU84_00570 [Prevotella sp.]|jgi:hypothetical protein|nr:hypothetical protein [Prevotella sp.]